MKDYVDTTGCFIYRAFHELGDEKRLPLTMIIPQPRIQQWVEMARKSSQDIRSLGCFTSRFDLCNEYGTPFWWVEAYPWDHPKSKHGKWTELYNLRQRIKDCEVRPGEFWYNETGRDCDGVVYESSPSLFKGNWYDWLKHIDHTAEWADGPFCLHIIHPDDVEDIQPYSRDLALEAFEDGHPHVLSEVRYETH